MTIELSLAASIPGGLIALHYAVQVLRPRWGHGSDMGGRRTPWIIGGMAALAAGGVLAALGTAWAANDRLAGLSLSVLAFALIGVGVGAAGTSLLALLAEQVDARRRPAAAAIVWIMMIVGFVITAGTAGPFLDPFSFERLVTVAFVVSLAAFAVTLGALHRLERPRTGAAHATAGEAPQSFRAALAEVWREPQARRFTIFVFGSMLAYSAQDLILEPFAGLVFGLSPGETTSLSGLQHAGVLLGMVLVGALGGVGGGVSGALNRWAVGGCFGSALALAGLTLAAVAGPGWPLRPNVFLLGFFNGVFAVAAIGSMMSLADNGAGRRQGTRVGLWGAAQGVAFGLGGFVGAVGVDLCRLVTPSQAAPFGAVFAAEAVLFVVSAHLALKVNATLRQCPVMAVATVDLVQPAAASGGRS
ncbi:BCD family MFS transporter [Salinarimonas soli]|uniref:BCD family MFS transporter n=2 Tax=Salinarimonas soli TaxID=1638099 RepID=A0A5B2VGU1_9HYPH|nr:BCD family MFS transporter [Salinarimonas soli]